LAVAGVILALILAAFTVSQFMHKGGGSKQEINAASPAVKTPSQPSAPALPPVPPPPPPTGGTTASVPPVFPPGGVTPPSQPPAAPSLPKPATQPAAAKKPAEASQPAVAVPPKAAPQPEQAASSAPASSAQPAPGAAEKAQLQEQQDRMMLLTGRVAAVSSSLNNLQRQQAASGLGLRGDMAAAKGSMDYLIGQAKSSLAAGDTASAKKNLDMAEQQLEKLERFLGL